MANTISNIVCSYDDPYDAFAELIQNALDAVAAQFEVAGEGYQPEVDVIVDVEGRSLTVRDNGTGVKWEDHREAVRPNYSLKRRRGQQTSRGEKGAALTFLQFGHADFELRTRAPGELGWRYRLTAGRDWFEQTVRLLEDGRPFEDKISEFPPSNLALVEEVESGRSTGTEVTVVFSDERLRDLLSDDTDVAFTRLEYILRTRTGLGFLMPGADRDELVGWQAALIARVQCAGDSRPLVTGFLYPHELAKRSGARKASLLTNPNQNSELLYEPFDRRWIKAYLPKIAASKRHMAVIDRFLRLQEQLVRGGHASSPVPAGGF